MRTQRRKDLVPEELRPQRVDLISAGIRQGIATANAGNVDWSWDPEGTICYGMRKNSDLNAGCVPPMVLVAISSAASRPLLLFVKTTMAFPPSRDARK